MLTNEQNALINRISRENGFKNFSFTVEQGSKKGDNYLGNIFSISIKENNENIKKRFILKCAETNAEVRKQIPIAEAYKREVFLYQTVLPAFEKFQQKYKLKGPFKAFTKILAYSLEDGNEYLLMENIRDQGFNLLDRKKTMSEEHVALVMKELGKLHSVSLAMNHLEPETYQNLVSNLEDYFVKQENFNNFFEENFENTFQVALNLVQDNPEATKALIDYQKNFIKLTEEMKDEKNHLVIVHGDAWCNNMMFKYEDKKNSTKPTSMCFIDWQISKKYIPVGDLFYYLFSAASKTILNDHKKYLQLYHQTIQENLESVGCDVQKIFPYELLQEQWKKFAKFGIFISLGNMKFLLKDEKEAKNFVEMSEGGKNLMLEFWNNEELSEECSERMRNIIFMMVKNEYL